MELIGDKVILRDFEESDINDVIRWETLETEWQLWDAPWENEAGNAFDAEKYRKDKLNQLEQKENENRIRRSFQICVNDEGRKHIGWCNSYNIDGHFEYTRERGFCTIGVDIPDLSARHRGYATAAWKLFIDYLSSNGFEDIYTQTWSGNERVLGLISKIGFEECQRKTGIRTVRGKSYDGLTFKLNWKKYEEFCVKCDNPFSRKERLSKKIYELEMRLLQPEIRQCPEEIPQLLSEDFIEFCSSGNIWKYHKGDIIDTNPVTSVKYDLRDFSIEILSDNVLLARYVSVKTDEKNGTAALANRSSIWKFTDNRWKMFFHQGTPALKQPFKIMNT